MVTGIEFWYYVSQIFLSIVTVVGIVLAYIEYRGANKRHKQLIKNSSIEKAANLAKLYEEELLYSIVIITRIFKDFQDEYGLIKVDLDTINNFDNDELYRLHSHDEINNSIAFINVKKYKNDERLISLIKNTLNKLEYFCMYFNSDVADNKTVYQSLHQTFFDVIQCLYVFIASMNVSDKDKYYTNVIQVFFTWREFYKEQCSLEESIKRKHNRHMLEIEESRKNIIVQSDKVK